MWPHGEEWLHEALLESYIPLLDALYELRAQGCPFRLTMDITPVLAEQLSDGDIKNHFVKYVADKIDRAREDEQRFSQEGKGHQASLAAFFRERYEQTLRSSAEGYGHDVVGAFRRLQDEGYLEIATSAATHAYLPLLERDSSIYAQLKTGADSYRHRFGRDPVSIWLPECAYRPGYVKKTASGEYSKPGLEEFLAELNIGCFFAETHGVEQGSLVGKVAGDVISPYGQVVRRLEATPGNSTSAQRSTYRAYRAGHPRVAVIGRNARTGLQVWSARHGYPGNFWYREFHKKHERSGLQYWRVSDVSGDLGAKDWYYPQQASQRVREHSEHFAGLVAELVRANHDAQGYGIVLSAYDAELFGHWWFEGIDWLKEVLRTLSLSTEVEMSTASDFVARQPPQELVALPESSWGVGGGHFTWYNGENRWMWDRIHDLELQVESLVGRFPQADGVRLRALNQAAREKLLAESSDWQFLVATGQAREYAISRFEKHLERFSRLGEMLERGQFHSADLTLLEEYEQLDNPFPLIDYRNFAARESLG